MSIFRRRLIPRMSRRLMLRGGSRFDESRTLVFMHVPKTSGTSITLGLIEASAPAVVISGFDHSLFGFSDDYSSLDEAIRCRIYSSPESMPKHADLVAGHLALSTLTKAYPNAQRITVLREPLSRLLSHWLYWRQLADSDLGPWGDLADFVRLAREPLVSFLSTPSLACQTDNLILRMLLWPHPLIAGTQFIDPIHDHRLLREAKARLRDLDFVDILENGAFVDRLQCWLGRSFKHDRLNETHAIPKQFRTPLQCELSPQARELLCARSRLDLPLWSKVASNHLPDRDVLTLRQQTILANVSRYSAFMTS